MQEAVKGLRLQFHQALALLTKPDHEVSSSLAVAFPSPMAQVFAPQVSLYEHLEDSAVNQALGVVLLNNYPLPKERVFNPAYFSDQVQRAVLPTAASAQ